MALVPCSACGKQVSEQAAACPSCGHPVAGYQPVRKWSPGVAAVLSLVIPGAGQMYRGKIGIGLLWLLCVVGAYAFFVIPGLILHLICIASAASEDPLWMANESRGVTLTIFALLFALMAISNFGKPFSHSPGVGFVFLGTRLSGVPNMIVAPIFGIILAVYAYGIFAMRKFALPIGIFYAAYVIVNMPLFILTYHGSAVMQEHSWAYLIPYPFVAIGVSSGAALLLYRRRSELA